jgi:Asp-tRNA(Asn)/Glu-tRNA(Gln) amidotransferase A subunit family amidase
MHLGAASLTARRAAESYHSGNLTPREVIEACRKRIEVREREVGAWQVVDWDFVSRQVEELGSRSPDDRSALLWGIPVGVKDMFDTADLPTGYGSEIYDGYRPAADAAAVARLRANGAIIVGKTVSTEFAYWKAGKTRNPRNTAHSPGGSSSGSAAAVADCMVPLALGTQTAASTIRPAAYCGIVGFKPSHGLISLAGIKALANSLDTVGAFGRSVDDCGLLAGVLTGRPDLAEAPVAQRPPSLALLRTPDWDNVSAECLAAIESAAHRLAGAGATVTRGHAPDAFAGLTAAQTTIMAYEAARELAFERTFHPDRLSDPLKTLLLEGESTAPETYDAARELAKTCQAGVDGLFGQTDALLAPSALSVAPRFEEGTGDPVMSRGWHLLGLPAISIPCGKDASGLPFGLQIAGRPGADAALISLARWVEAQLA